MKSRAALMGVSLCLLNYGCGTTGSTTRSLEVPGMILGGVVGAGSLALIGAASRYGGLARWAAGGGALGTLVGWYAGHQLKPSRDPDLPAGQAGAAR